MGLQPLYNILVSNSYTQLDENTCDKFFSFENILFHFFQTPTLPPKFEAKIFFRSSPDYLEFFSIHFYIHSVLIKDVYVTTYIRCL